MVQSSQRYNPSICTYYTVFLSSVFRGRTHSSPVMLRNDNASTLSKVDSKSPGLAGFRPSVSIHANIHMYFPLNGLNGPGVHAKDAYCAYGINAADWPLLKASSHRFMA